MLTSFIKVLCCSLLVSHVTLGGDTTPAPVENNTLPKNKVETVNEKQPCLSCAYDALAAALKDTRTALCTASNRTADYLAMLPNYLLSKVVAKDSPYLTAKYRNHKALAMATALGITAYVLWNKYKESKKRAQERPVVKKTVIVRASSANTP